MTTHEPGTLVWRKSSYSGGNGDCVEVAWRKSSYSGGNGACVEVAPAPEAFLVRDSKDPAGPILTLPIPHFRRFLHALPAGSWPAG
jgi:hypothetical protein